MSKLEENKIIKFDSSKQFKFIRHLGHGGTGDTNLFLDESVDMLFAIKKYSPNEINDKDECYTRFIEEIKILFTIYHKNIVRIFNYYLYPNYNMGYIQMEYIDGKTIDKINPNDYGKTWNEYFADAINAFCYLYDNNILHRDIRPSNFMITKNGELKIIDFGFGKKISNMDEKNSVILNWPATLHPEEVVLNQEYNYSTEIYYIGELFKHLVVDDPSFLYSDVINKMMEYSPSNRYSTYEEIKNDIMSNLFSQISFSYEDKIKYKEFADGLLSTITKFTSNPQFNYNLEEIRVSLEKIVKVSSIEEYVQRNSDLISCFVNAGFRYKTKPTIKSKTLVGFYSLFINTSLSKKSIIIESIVARFKNVSVEIDTGDSFEDLPF